MKRINITLRLAGAFCLLATIFFIIGWRGVARLRTIDGQLQNIAYDRWQEGGISNKAYRLSAQNNQIALLIFLTNDPNEIQKLLAERSANTKSVTEILDILVSRMDTDDERRLLAVVRAKRTSYLESCERALRLLLKEHQPTQAHKMMADEVQPNLAAYHDAWDAFNQLEAEEVEGVMKQSKIDFATSEQNLLEMLAVGGLITGVIAVYTVMRTDREIVVRYQAEERLRQAHDQLEQRVMDRTSELARTNETLRLLNSAVLQCKESILITDAELDLPGPKIIFANPAFAGMTGYAMEEALGKTPRILQGPLTDRTVLRRLRENLESGGMFEGEAINYRKDGTKFNLEWQVAPLRDVGGTVTHFVAIQRNIDERKGLEARLFQAQKMETIGKLAGGVAHEFNSILTAIIGQSELLLGDLPPKSSLIKSASEIHTAANRAAILTRQLLAYGRKQMFQPENLDLNAVLSGMGGTLRQLVGRAIDVKIVPAVDLKAVKADAGQIEEVIINIVRNAVDAMPNGGKLTLETANVTLDDEYASHFPDVKSGDYVMLAITDTGTGMNYDVKTRVFDPFFSTKAPGKGTGLGLSTSYGIVKQSSGHINLYTELGRGTAFKIYLPQMKQPVKSAAPRANPADLPRGSETIMLVEDDPALREMAGALLTRLGYTVWAAANGVEALSLKQNHETELIDLLFTDVVMPQMSGEELSKLVMGMSPKTRILFTSAYTENAIVHQGVLDKGIQLLPKPFTPMALATKVREVLDQNSL